MGPTSRIACGKSTRMRQPVACLILEHLCLLPSPHLLGPILSTTSFASCNDKCKLRVTRIPRNEATFYDEPVVIWRTANTFHQKGHCGQEGGYCLDVENKTVLRQVAHQHLSGLGAAAPRARRDRRLSLPPDLSWLVAPSLALSSELTCPRR